MIESAALRDSLDERHRFFADESSMWCQVHAGAYAIFFPKDAHAPMVSNGEIHKIILKVAV